MMTAIINKSAFVKKILLIFIEFKEALMSSKDKVKAVKAKLNSIILKQISACFTNTDTRQVVKCFYSKNKPVCFSLKQVEFYIYNKTSSIKYPWLH